MDDTVAKLRVLSLLNCELFDEVNKKEESDLINMFGPQAGSLMFKHAKQQEKFKNINVEDGTKMIPLDDEFI